MRAPVTRTNEFTMPSLNSDQAGAVLSIGSIKLMPVREANQVSNAVMLLAKMVGFSVASSAGRMQAGLVLRYRCCIQVVTTPRLECGSDAIGAGAGEEDAI